MCLQPCTCVWYAVSTDIRVCYTTENPRKCLDRHNVANLYMLMQRGSAVDSHECSLNKTNLKDVMDIVAKATKCAKSHHDVLLTRPTERICNRHCCMVKSVGPTKHLS